MNKEQFMRLLGEAYQFPAYYSNNLNSADEILEDLKEEEGREKISLQPFFTALLVEEPEEECRKIWELLSDHFVMGEAAPAP